MPPWQAGMSEVDRRRMRRWSIGAAIGVGVAVVTSLALTGGGVSERCSRSTDCRLGLQCTRGVMLRHNVCTEVCRTDDDCPDGSLCSGDAELVTELGDTVVDRESVMICERR